MERKKRRRRHDRPKSWRTVRVAGLKLRRRHDDLVVRWIGVGARRERIGSAPGIERVPPAPNVIRLMRPDADRRASRTPAIRGGDMGVILSMPVRSNDVGLRF